MKRIFVPTKSASDWRGLLKEPNKQWSTGYSAKTLAHCWETADGFPTSVSLALDASGAKQLSSLTLLAATPEIKVPLPGGEACSQTDLVVLARNDAGLVVMAVEGKVDESFAEQTREWFAAPSDGKRARLAFLCECLELSQTQALELRYQLLHRTVSSLLIARQFHASTAVMLVHSFSPTCRWFEDFAAFVRALGAEPLKDSVALVGERLGIQLFLGWVCGEPAFLSA